MKKLMVLAVLLSVLAGCATTGTEWHTMWAKFESNYFCNQIDLTQVTLGMSSEQVRYVAIPKSVVRIGNTEYWQYGYGVTLTFSHGWLTKISRGEN